MPAVRFRDRSLICLTGDNLRDVLLRAGESPHNEGARLLNCRGLGSCGTCALLVEGPVSPPTAIERWRLQFPPHRAGSGLRLACQVRVLGDLTLRKGSGFWGQHPPAAEAASGDVSGSTES